MIGLKKELSFDERDVQELIILHMEDCLEKIRISYTFELPMYSTYHCANI